MNNIHKQIINESNDTLINKIKFFNSTEVNQFFTECRLINSEKSIEVAFQAIDFVFNENNSLHHEIEQDNLAFLLKQTVIKDKPLSFSYIIKQKNMSELFDLAFSNKPYVSLMTFIINSGKFQYLDSALTQIKDKESLSEKIIQELISQKSNFQEGFRSDAHQKKITHLLEKCFTYVNFKEEQLGDVFKSILSGGAFQKRTWNRDEFKNLVTHEILSSYSFAYKLAFKLFINKYPDSLTQLNLDGYTTLTYLCKKYSEQTVMNFLDNFSKNADLVNKKDSFGKYPLNYYDISELKEVGATEKAENVTLLNFKKLIYIIKQNLLGKKVLKDTQTENKEDIQENFSLSTSLNNIELKAFNNLTHIENQWQGEEKKLINQVLINLKELFTHTHIVLDVFEKTHLDIYNNTEDKVFIQNNVIQNMDESIYEYTTTLNTLKNLSTQPDKINLKIQEMSGILLENIDLLKAKITTIENNIIESLTDNSKTHLQTQSLKLKMFL